MREGGQDLKNPVKEVSLSEALKMPPVDFGRKNKNNNQSQSIKNDRPVGENKSGENKSVENIAKPKTVVVNNQASLVKEQREVILADDKKRTDVNECDFDDDDEIDF
jgi:hypothetical protein